MAGVDLGAGRPAKKAKGGLKRPKRRVNIRIDMTPMVDIAFLLLIFYMVTTIFSAPLSMEIALPPKVEGTPPERQIAQSHLLQIFVDKNDAFYFQIGAMKQPERVTFEQMGKIIEERTLQEMKDLVIVLKLDQAASYKHMVNIIDSIQDVERRINAGIMAASAGSDVQKFSSKFSLQDMTAWDEHVLGIVSSGGTVEE
jgi:biopolymer transport protein ExbD